MYSSSRGVIVRDTVFSIENTSTNIESVIRTMNDENNSMDISNQGEVGEDEEGSTKSSDEHKGSGTPMVLRERKQADATNRLLEMLINDAEKITLERVQDLIERGASVDSHDKNGRGSALVWSLIKSSSIGPTSSEIVRELLKHYKGDLGPECIRNNNQEMTLLMFAIVTACNFSVIREVIERMKELNIDINTKDTDQNTALIYAARYGQKNVCDHLLSCGAHVNAISKGFYGIKMTAMDYALNSDVRKSLENCGGKTYDDLKDMVPNRDVGRSGSISSVASFCGGDRVSSRSRTDSIDSPRKRPLSPHDSNDSVGGWWTCSCVRPRDASE